MTAQEKPEVYLEVGCGFLRIPTEAVNYNITLLAPSDPYPPRPELAPTAPTVPAKAEPPAARVTPAEPPPVPVSTATAAPVENPEPSFLNLVCHQTYNDLNRLAEEMELSLVVSAPQRQEVDPELEARLRGAGRQARNLAGALADMGRHVEQAALALDQERGARSEASALVLSELRQQFAAAMDLVAAMAEAGAAAPKAAAPVSKPKELRYAFDLDTVFQTIYELCTNETVKTHISGARAKAATIFTKEIFWSKISPLVPSYPVDDGFVNVPMSDMFPALAAACSEKAIVNLFTKMEAGKSSIFLDQSLPLALPEPEEIGGGEAEAAPALPAEPDPRLIDLQAMLAASLGSVEQLSASAEEPNPAADRAEAKAAWEESGAQVALAQETAKELEAELEALALLLSQGGEAGAGGELELLAESRVKLQALAITLGSQLRQHEADGGVAFIESLSRAQEEAEAYLARVSKRNEPLASPLSAAKEPDELEQLEGFAELAELEESPPARGVLEDADMGLDLDLDLDSAPTEAAGADLELEPLPEPEEEDAFASSGVEAILGELQELDALDKEDDNLASPPAATGGGDLAEQNDIDKLLAEMGM